MSILNFENKNQFKIYCNKKFNDKNFIDSGSEGACYLGWDGYAYKILFDEYEDDINSIITEEDLYSKNFFFPKDLFTIKGSLVGYKSRASKKDLFKSIANFNKEILLPIAQIDKINIDILINAYLEMKNEINTLTNKKIEIIDLTYNLIFDGKTLIGIDTCHYTKNTDVTLKENQQLLDKAIKAPFLYNTSLPFSHEELSYLEQIPNTVDFLKQIDKSKVKFLKK